MKINTAVILAGGLGTRLREETEFRPKPMVEIGGKPILWHIMKNLHQQGISNFIICLGYKGEKIKEYFYNYKILNGDICIDYDSNKVKVERFGKLENWQVTLVETGLETMTGGRLNKIKHLIDDSQFLCTYGDGVADIDLDKLSEFHTTSKTIATLTAVRPTSRFGALKIDNGGRVLEFNEKPQIDEWVNGGFFVFENEIFEYLDDQSVLEKQPLTKLCENNQLSAYKHYGFWQPMDTFRETQELNRLLSENNAPWVNW